MERDAIDFGSLKVSVLFRRLFIPTLCGMLSISAVTVADGIFVGQGVGQRRHRRREYLRPAADGLSGNGLHDRYRLLGGGFDPLVAVEDPGGPPERHAGDGVRDGGDLAAVFGDSAFPRPDRLCCWGLRSICCRW